MSHLSLLEFTRRLYRRLINGEFYDDHDADLALCSDLHWVATMLARLENMRVETMIERWSEDGIRKRAYVHRFKIEVTTAADENWMAAITDNKMPYTRPGANIYMGLHHDLWVALSMALADMDQKQGKSTRPQLPIPPSHRKWAAHAQA